MVADGWLAGWFKESSVGKACFKYDGALWAAVMH
jgi:hypothetical protein